MVDYTNIDKYEEKYDFSGVGKFFQLVMVEWFFIIFLGFILSFHNISLGGLW